MRDVDKLRDTIRSIAGPRIRLSTKNEEPVSSRLNHGFHD
jgi:hypothetical protein